MSFSSANDADWFTFTAPEAGVYMVDVYVPPGAPTEVVVAYGTNCDILQQDMNYSLVINQQ